MDYRAAGAAAYLGLGAVWALGLSSSAAQLQANPASLPPSILAITGVIPFTETIFLWQSGVMLLALILVSLVIAYMTAPSAASARDAKDCGVDVSFTAPARLAPTRPGEWLEHSPLLIILLVLLAGGWLVHEFSTKPAILAISGLNTYNLLFLMLGALLHWRPRSFLDAVARAVPTTTGVLIQFPLYGSIAAIMTTVTAATARPWPTISRPSSYRSPPRHLRAADGRVLGGAGLLHSLRRRQVDHRGAVRDAGGQRAAIPPRLGGADLQRRRGAAEPDQSVYMLPLLGVLGLKARDLIGFSFVQLLVHIPLVLVLLWALGSTLAYIPPVMP